MNKKGQTLITFLLLLPLILTFLVFIINEGEIYIIKRRASNNVKRAINYWFETKEEVTHDKLQTFLYKNIEQIKALNLNFDKEQIKVNITVNAKGSLPMIIKKDPFLIKLSYKGYLKEEKLIIEKE